MRSVGTEVRALRTRLHRLKKSITLFGRQTQMLGRPSRRGYTLRLTDKQRAYLKLQGRYMGLMRHLATPQKSLVRAMRAQHGIQRAIALKRMLAHSTQV